MEKVDKFARDRVGAHVSKIKSEPTCMIGTKGNISQVLTPKEFVLVRIGH
jgi:hypothetical protein